MEKNDRRRHPRAPVNRPGRIRVSDGPVTHVQLMNISPRGASLFYSTPLPVGTTVELNFRLNGSQEPLNLAGHVLQSHLRGESHWIRVVFMNPPGSVTKVISEFAQNRSAAAN